MPRRKSKEVASEASTVDFGQSVGSVPMRRTRLKKNNVSKKLETIKENLTESENKSAKPSRKRGGEGSVDGEGSKKNKKRKVGSERGAKKKVEDRKSEKSKGKTSPSEKRKNLKAKGKGSDEKKENDHDVDEDSERDSSSVSGVSSYSGDSGDLFSELSEIPDRVVRSKSKEKNRRKVPSVRGQENSGRKLHSLERSLGRSLERGNVKEKSLSLKDLRVSLFRLKGTTRVMSESKFAERRGDILKVWEKERVDMQELERGLWKSEPLAAEILIANGFVSTGDIVDIMGTEKITHKSISETVAMPPSSTPAEVSAIVKLVNKLKCVAVSSLSAFDPQLVTQFEFVFNLTDLKEFGANLLNGKYGTSFGSTNPIFSAISVPAGKIANALLNFSVGLRVVPISVVVNLGSGASFCKDQAALMRFERALDAMDKDRGKQRSDAVRTVMFWTLRCVEEKVKDVAVAERILTECLNYYFTHGRVFKGKGGKNQGGISKGGISGVPSGADYSSRGLQGGGYGSRGWQGGDYGSRGWQSRSKGSDLGMESQRIVRPGQEQGKNPQISREQGSGAQEKGVKGVSMAKLIGRALDGTKLFKKYSWTPEEKQVLLCPWLGVGCRNSNCFFQHERAKGRMTVEEGEKHFGKQQQGGGKEGQQAEG